MMGDSSTIILPYFWVRRSHSLARDVPAFRRSRNCDIELRGVHARCGGGFWKGQLNEFLMASLYLTPILWQTSQQIQPQPTAIVDFRDPRGTRRTAGPPGASGA